VPTIGRHEDLEAATMDDVKAFFATWYVPNNASLSICGDFDPEEAKALVEQYFGEIPRGPDPSHATVEPTVLTEEKVVRETDAVPHHKVWIAWPTPPLYAEGDADLDILSDVLTDGKESRLYERLVRDKQIAKDVNAFQYSARLQGQYIITATAAAGHSTDEVVAEIDAVLAELREAGPTDDEVGVSKLNWEANFYNDLLSINSKANRLNSYNTITGDPGFIEADQARYQAVTADSVQATIQRHLTPTGRVVLHVSPEEGE